MYSLTPLRWRWIEGSRARAPCCAWSKREKWTVMLSSALPILLCQIVFGKKYRLQLDCKCQEITWKLLPCLTEGKKGRDWMDSISKLYIQGNRKTQMNLVILLMLGRLGRKCDFGKVFYFWGCFLHGQKMYLKVELIKTILGFKVYFLGSKYSKNLQSIVAARVYTSQSLYYLG